MIVPHSTPILLIKLKEFQQTRDLESWIQRNLYKLKEESITHTRMKISVTTDKTTLTAVP